MFLKIPKKVEYGLIACFHLGRRGSARPVSRNDIAQENRIPVELLGKVLQAMARAGLVDSAQGVHGGYRLARPLAAITIGDVVLAIDGPMHLVPCTDGDSTCEQEPSCCIKDPMARVEERLQRYFFGLSLGDLREHTVAAGDACSCHEAGETPHALDSLST